MNLIAPRAKETADYIRQRWSQNPQFGIVLGSGLGNLADEIEDPTTFSFDELPNFSRATAAGHQGNVIGGVLAGENIIAMQGRTHLYEGYSAQDVAFPIRVMQEIGVKSLIVSNASGGLNPLLQTGDIVVIDDQVNLMFANPLFGINDDNLGPRFPDMCQTYDQQLSARAIEIARRRGFLIHRGVYAAVCGPNYETRAEIRMLRQLGADIVGMSTVPEVIVAVHAGMKVLGLSVVTNVCSPDVRVETTGEHVVMAAESTQPRMRDIVLGVLSSETTTSNGICGNIST